jgi:hypothetical protein
MNNITVDQLINRINRVYRNLVVNKADIIEWVFEALADAGSFDHFEEANGMELSVSGGVAKLPVNAFRVLNIRTSSGRCEPSSYVIKQSCIQVHDSLTKIWVDLLVFRIDDNYEPYIDDVFEEAAYWYCVRNLITEPWSRGEVRDAVYQEAKNNYAIASAKSRGSFRNVTRDEMNRMLQLVRSSVIVPRAR